MANKIRMTKHGLAENPRGLCVKMNYRGRELLGKVIEARYNEFGAPGFSLSVAHFCGEPWPVQSSPYAVEII